MKTYICLQDVLHKLNKLYHSYDSSSGIDNDAKEAVEQAQIIVQSIPRLVKEDALEQISCGYTLDEYQKDAARTINEKLTDQETLSHASYGLSGEVGEISSIFQKRYQGHKMEKSHIIKELGDLLWFIAEMCTSLGVSLAEVAMANIRKLLIRYPDKFTEDRSVNREKYGTTDRQMEGKNEN